MITKLKSFITPAIYLYGCCSCPEVYVDRYFEIKTEFAGPKATRLQLPNPNPKEYEVRVHQDYLVNAKVVCKYIGSKWDFYGFREDFAKKSPVKKGDFCIARTGDEGDVKFFFAQFEKSERVFPLDNKLTNIFVKEDNEAIQEANLSFMSKDDWFRNFEGTNAKFKRLKDEFLDKKNDPRRMRDEYIEQEADYTFETMEPLPALYIEYEAEAAFPTRVAYKLPDTNLIRRSEVPENAPALPAPEGAPT